MDREEPILVYIVVYISILKLKKSNRWKIYDLDIQSVSLIDIFKIGYDSKIKRQGIERLVNKMMSNS